VAAFFWLSNQRWLCQRKESGCPQLTKKAIKLHMKLRSDRRGRLSYSRRVAAPSRLKSIEITHKIHMKLRSDRRGRLSYSRRLAALSRLKSIENTHETLRQAQGDSV